jgi:cell wall-associated NlpC family hydrolase
MRRLALLLAALLLVVAAGGGLAFATGASRSAGPAPRGAQERADLPPLPAMRPKIVEPAAGELAAAADAEVAPAASEEESTPKPTQPASRTRPAHDAAEVAGDGTRAASALPNGIALPPLEAPEAVHQIIEAGNVIARSPYKWGGGHGRWLDKGYDCSGSVSFALAAAGLLNAPLDSGRLMSWGRAGRGKWVTIYSNRGHVFMVVAGVRFDTSGARRTGSRWQNDMRPTAGFVARHPPGL